MKTTKTLLVLLLATLAFSTFAEFAGRDPRVPGFQEQNFKLPFKVMFIGAHPDDADFQSGALALKVARAGGRVRFVSVCNGNKGHQTMTSEALAARRQKETQASAKVLGVEQYLVLGEPDCEVESTLALRRRITKLIREFAPNLVITHRTCDYHADHRAVAQTVQDATYLMGVPLYCPETPVPETLPFVMYHGDRFTVPRPFRADMIVGDDDVLDTVISAWACHESQVFEWLPPELGLDPKAIPSAADPAGRHALIRTHMLSHLKGNGRLHRTAIDRAWGGKGPECVEVFELCDYARSPASSEIAFLKSLGFKWMAVDGQ